MDKSVVSAVGHFGSRTTADPLIMMFFFFCAVSYVSGTIEGIVHDIDLRSEGILCGAEGTPGSPSVYGHSRFAGEGHHCHWTTSHRSSSFPCGLVCNLARRIIYTRREAGTGINGRISLLSWTSVKDMGTKVLRDRWQRRRCLENGN
jgi:hypothetical protein